MWFLYLLTVILKIILILIAFILVVIAILIFVPVCYDGFFEKNKSFHIKASATWFFRGVILDYEKSPKKTSMKLRLFGKIIGRGKKKKTKKDKQKTKDEPQETKVIEEPIEIQASDNITEETETVNTVKEKDKKQKKEKPEEIDETTEEADEPNEGLLKKVKALYDYPDRDILISLTFRLCRDLLIALKPEKFSLNMEVGAGDPAVTGYLIGFVESVKPFLGIDIYIRGNFEKPALSGHMAIKGKLYLYKFILPLCRYAFAKPVWKLIKKYFFKKDEEK